jgi:O-acetyl-ADP-ribose deacetylase (regulator of RNase III)
MKRIVTGNLLEADAEALVNTVNTEGVMGKGIALQFNKAYPQMFKEYTAACKEGKVQIGQVHVHDLGRVVNPRFILNFPTKRHWRTPSRLEDIRAGLEALVREVKARGIRSVAIPPLGCGLGGLRWEDVLPLIEKSLDQVPDVDALIYAPTGAPDPARMPNATSRPEMTPRRANVVRALSQYGILGYELTLIEIQKVLYFLQEAGEALKLRFVRGPYGPYADNLRHVLHRFEGHFILGFGEGRNQPDTAIRLLPKAVEKAGRVSEQASDPEDKERIGRVFELIEGYESPYGMELLSSVHWLIAHDLVTPDPGAVTAAAHAWSERKSRVLKPDHIALALGRLADRGWTVAAAGVARDAGAGGRTRP